MRTALVVLACILPPVALLLARMPGQALLNFVLCAATVLSTDYPWLTVGLSLAVTIHAVWMVHRRNAAQAT